MGIAVSCPDDVVEGVWIKFGPRRQKRHSSHDVDRDANRERSGMNDLTHGRGGQGKPASETELTGASTK